MRPPKIQAIRKNTIRPPFTRTNVRMTTNLVSRPRASRRGPARRANVVIGRNALIGRSALTVLIGRSVTAAVDRPVAVSAMTSVHRVAPVRTSPSV